jgi:hypothetical protein
MKDKEFNNILNECLERLLKGETIEHCLKSYPGQATALKPLLETALAAKRASAIKPRADFKARASYQFRLALQESAPRPRPFFGWFPQWATVTAIVLVLLLAGSSTVVAAGNSMPDSSLYPVKLATEQAQLALNLSTMGKARLCAEMADRRVAEIIYLAEEGDFQQIEPITQNLDNRLTLLAALALAQKGGEAPMMMAPQAGVFGEREGHPPTDNRGWLRTTVGDHAAHHQVILQALLEQAPPSARPTLLHAINVSTTGYQNALDALD